MCGAVGIDCPFYLLYQYILTYPLNPLLEKGDLVWGSGELSLNVGAVFKRPPFLLVVPIPNTFLPIVGEAPSA